MEEQTLIVGHASVFNQWTTLYEGRYWSWREVIRPGAYKNALAESQDVRALFNHDSNFVLGRTKCGTLALSEDSIGLLSEIQPPDTQTVRDLVLTPIERGDVSGMSFAWSARKAERTITTEDEATDSTIVDYGGLRVTLRMDGERLMEEWEVLDADLFDVSPVTYPAYDGTDVALRSALGIEERAAEMDRPHTRSAPDREQVRRWLAEFTMQVDGQRQI
jgi:HK97 family phage prohead protease